MINANAKILNIGRKSLARVRRSFFAVAPLMLFVSAGFAPGARADTPTNVHATIFTTAINYYWELNAPLEDPLPVISTAADFDPAVSTYAVTAGHGQVAYTFENLTPNLTYYFRVKVATEPDTSYTATFTTSTYIESPAGVYFDEVSTRSIVASAYGPVFTGLYTGLSGTAIDRDSAGYSAWRKADTWATRTDMPTARHSFAAAALGGKIYAVGGEDGSGFLNTNEEYDPASDSWATKTPMPTARAQLAAAEAGGKIYAIGGSPGPLITNEEYDPEADAWTTKATMLSSRRSLAAAVVNGKIYAIGGTSNSTKNEEYNPATNAWAMKANMPTARYDLAAAAVAGKIYVMGGTPDNTATLTKNEEYNPATNSWITKAPMPTARKQLAAAVLGGKIYVLGGNPDALLALNEEYTPAADTWTVRAAMLQARSAPAAAEARGRIYAIGGYNSGYLARNDVYDPGLAVPYTGLIPNTQYTFTAKSRNSMGTEAPASGLVPVSTYTLAALPGAPGIVARSALTQEVSWDPNGNPSPSGTNYRLKYSTSPAFTAAVTTSAVIGSTFTAVAGLVPNTSYYYDVAAVNDLGVQTAFTGRPASAGTLAALPGAPDITGRSAATQTISWASGGNPLPGTDYLLKYSTSGNFTPSVTTAAVVASTFTTVAGLDAGTSYYYDVAAVARDGTQTAFTGTPAAGYTLPAAPGTPVPAVLGVSSVSWSWAAAGSALNYKLYVASSPATLMATVAAPPYIRTGISTNTYTGILVAAVNLAGESAKSDSVSTYTLAAVPVNLSTAAAPATSTITVQWGANGNPALTQYRVDYWQQGGATTTFLTVQASTAVGGLTESTSYYFAVSALNGAGFYSAPAAPLLMPTRAGAPAGLADEAMDAASIRWTWSTVPTARSYKVYLASEPATVIGAVTAPLFLQTGLSTNTQTGVMVAAVNLAGDGVKSAAVNSYPLAAIPGVPDITNSSDTFQTLLWASRGNPAPGTNYRLKYSTSVAFLTEITTVAVVASTYTRVESLVPNTLYHYDVAAVNNNGIETPFTGVTVSSYTMAAIPGPPAIYRVTDITQSVSWAPRGNPVPGTNYRVKYSTSSGFEAGVTTTVVVASTFTTLPNLVPNTSYYYDAAAVSNIGIQTGFSGVPAVGYTLAAVPGDPSFTGWTDTTQSLEWAAGGNPDPGTRYYIEYSTSADFTPSVSTAVVAASTFTTVTGLTPGTSYYHRVAALNNVGLRSAFAGAVIDGYTLPPPPGKPEAADLGASSITWTWAASTSAVTYNIHLISDPGVTVAVQAGPPYVQLGLSTNTFNGIVVTAVNPGGEGALSPYPLICTRAALPGAPAITAQSSVTQSIAWDAGGNPGPGTDYRLKYSTSANFTVSVTTAILVQSSSAYITGLALGTSYYYDVAAVNLDGVQTAFTGAPAAGFTLPAAPGDPSAASVEPTYIVWTWTAIKSAIRYNIYAASAPAAVIASVAAPPFTEPGLSSNTLNGILVAAVNPAGEGLRSPAVSTYTLAAVPGAPAILDRSAIGQTLGWNGNGNPNPGTNYLVRYSTSPAFTPSATVTEMTSSTTAAVGGLAPNTSYYFDVAAINVSGFQTDFTGAPAAGYTLAAIPDPPFIVGRSSSTQDIAWNNGGNPGQGTRYRLKYSTAPDFDAQVTTSVVVASTFTRIAGLAANTSYYYDVAGINDPGLQTPFSGSPGAGYTLAASPGAPFITGRTFTAQSVAWNNGGNPDPGTSYLLEYSTSASFTPAVTTMTVSASTVATVTGLVPGTSYYYDVAAFNSVGMLTAFTGVPAAGYTLSSAPVPVPAVLGVSSISWTWAEVAGALNYIVYAASEPATVIASPSAPVFIETGLSTNTSYGILVSAVNPAGEGAQSAAVSTYTFAAGPLALSTGPAAADTSSIEVQWSTNTNPAGTQYRVDYWPQGGSVSTLVTVQASTAVTGLTEATSYYFTVRAVNGAGFYSAAAGPLFMTTLPGAPAGLAGAALDAGSIRWTWNAVPTAAGYKVYLASETATVIASPAEPSFTEAGLSTNTLNGVLVAAVNSAGEGVKSGAVSTYTLSAVPLSLSTGPAAATSNSITVQWDANTNPAGILYRVDYGTSVVATSSYTTVSASVTLSGLAESTSYYFQVRAANDAGMLSLPALLVVPTLPGAPARPVGAVLGASSISWNWAYVPTAVSYNIYPSSEPATVIAAVAAPPFVQTGLTPNSIYSIMTTVFNTSGAGPQSDAATEVWTFANPPAGLDAAAVYITSAAITWDLNGNPPDTEFEVIRSTNNLDFTGDLVGAPDTDFSGMVFTDGGLLACTSYYFKVRNTNHDNVATVYSSASFLTKGYEPLPPGGLSAVSLAGNRILLSWEPSMSGRVTQYALYFDSGTGTIDYGAPLAVLGSTVASYTTDVLVSSPAYKFGLRAGLCGNEEANTSVTASAASTATLTGLRAAVKVPQAGRKISGDRITVMAELVQGSAGQAKQLSFQYKASTSSEWLDIPAAEANHPNPDTEAPYLVHWDVTGLTPAGYELRAVASDFQDNPDQAPPAVGVVVDPADPDISENSQGGGGIKKEQKLNNAVANTVQAGGASSDQVATLGIPAGALSASTVTVSMNNNPALTPPAPADAQPYGTVTEISLSNGQTLLAGGETAEVTLSFADADNDGYADGTNVRTETLQIYTAPSLAGPWGKDFASVVDRSSKTVTGYTPHFSFFALFSPLGTDMDAIEVFPVPFMPNDSDPDNGAAYRAADPNSGIIFNKLPASVKIRIYTLTGQLAASFGSASTSGKLQWDVKNDSGRDVASGGYIAVISSPGRKDAVRKILVVR